MKTNPFGMDLGMMNANPMLAWWQQQLMKSANPMALQAAWMESLAEAMTVEAQFLKALAESGEQMAQCLSGEKPATPEEMQACYQNVMKQMTDAHQKRMDHVAELSHDFRKQLWEEI